MGNDKETQRQGVAGAEPRKGANLAKGLCRGNAPVLRFPGHRWPHRQTDRIVQHGQLLPRPPHLHQSQIPSKPALADRLTYS